MSRNPIQFKSLIMQLLSGIDAEPAFAWLVGTIHPQEKTANIEKVKTQSLLRLHKFGIELPKSIKDALAIDQVTNTMYWKDAIALESKNVDVAFPDLEDGESVPFGYQQIRFPMILDIKVGSLKCKARYIAGGHETKQPASMTYSIVVS
jgi:hypothetical protein